MAVGDLLGVLLVAQNSITNPCPATHAGITVAVGDLIVAVLSEQTSLTVTAWADNLGNTYTPITAGDDPGAITCRAAYARVTNAGTLTTVNATTTASANNAVHVAAVFGGPFPASPLDANPAQVTSDLTSPLTCPTTGTLVDEI